MENVFTKNQQAKIKKNLDAFIYRFGEPTIKKVINGKGFLVFRPGEEPKEDNYVQYCENIDYLNGWLYGCVQTTCGQIKAKEKSQPKMVTRNEYYNYIRENGRIPKDDEMEIIPLDLSHYHLSEDTIRIANANFTEETTNRNGEYMLSGHWMSDLSYQFAKKCKFDLVQIDGYSSYAYSDEQMAVFTYCEGDITLTPYEDREKYLMEKVRTIKFYKEE